MSSKMRRSKNPDFRKPRTQVKDMIRCPLCNCLSYPRVLSEPEGEEEKKALYCGSCKENMTPFFEAYAEFAKIKQKEQLAKEAEEAKKLGEEMSVNG
jgi:hypothetical protein